MPGPASDRTGATPQRPLSLPVELVLIAAAWLAYFGIRAVTQGSEDAAMAHAHDLMHFEEWLGIDYEADAQSTVDAHRWLLDLGNWIYIWGHWPVIAATAVLLFRHRQAAYRRLRNAMFVSGGIGLVIFAAYPVAPPRLAGFGLVDTVTDYSHSYRALQPPALTNIYASMPSLHFGWDLLVGITVALEARHLAVRLAGVMMPVLMAFAVIVTANHFVVDIVAGGTLALVGLAVAVWLERRAAERAARERQRPSGSLAHAPSFRH
jgi:membrane-associated phospholipid phosphatase